MAENDSKKTPDAGAQKCLTVATLRNTSARSAEYLSVSYNIEKISGLRSGKRCNSFRTNPNTNLRAIIQSVLKKIKFSTKYKYIVLFFDQNKNSKKYSGWRKFKENSGIDASRQEYPSTMKIRVCRCKAEESKPPPQADTLNTPAASAPNMGLMYGMPYVGTPQPITPEYAAMYFRYFMFMQCSRMMGVNYLAQ